MPAPTRKASWCGTAFDFSMARIGGPSWPQPIASTLPSKARLTTDRNPARSPASERRHGVDVAQQEQPAAELGDQGGDRIARLDDDFALRTAAHAGGQRQRHHGGAEIGAGVHQGRGQLLVGDAQPFGPPDAHFRDLRARRLPGLGGGAAPHPGAPRHVEGRSVIVADAGTAQQALDIAMPDA